MISAASTAAALALVLSLAPSASAISTPDQGSSATTADREFKLKQQKKISRGIFKHTNRFRRGHGLNRLRDGKCVDRAANRQARKMARRQEIFHQDLGKILDKCEAGRVGENVASGGTTGRSVVRMWKNSEGHRANLLGEKYTHLGVGAVRRGGTLYSVQVFLSR